MIGSAEIYFLINSGNAARDIFSTTLAIELIFPPLFKLYISTPVFFIALITCNEFKCVAARYVQNEVFVDDSTSHHNHRRQVQCLLSKIVSLIASDLITCIVPVFKKLLATLRKSVEAICLRKSSQMSLMNSGIKDFGGAHFGFTLLLNDNIKVFVPIYPSSHHAFPTFLNLCIAGNNMAGNLHRHEALQHHSIARLHLISEYN